MNATQQVLAEGKTKKILATLAPFEVDVFNKSDITAGDGTHHDVIEGKGALATRTTANCFELLERNDIATHFVQRVNDTTFRARKCRAIPIESVARGVATGSYLKRNHEAIEGEFFDPLVLEFFYKDDERGDPMMQWCVESQKWNLHSAKEPVSEASLLESIGLRIRNRRIGPVLRDQMLEITDKVFRVLRTAWEQHDVLLVDLKIEFGLDVETGDLLVMDVIDNDSWRIWPAGRKEDDQSKQVYRDAENRDAKTLGQIKKNYDLVADWTDAFSDAAQDTAD